MTSLAYLHDCHCCYNERSNVQKKKHVSVKVTLKIARIGKVLVATEACICTSEINVNFLNPDLSFLKKEKLEANMKIVSLFCVGFYFIHGFCIIIACVF